MPGVALESEIQRYQVMVFLFWKASLSGRKTVMLKKKNIKQKKNIKMWKVLIGHESRVEVLKTECWAGSSELAPLLGKQFLKRSLWEETGEGRHFVQEEQHVQRVVKGPRVFWGILAWAQGPWGECKWGGSKSYKMISGRSQHSTEFFRTLLCIFTVCIYSSIIYLSSSVT